jgi:hypothetical protein
MLQSSAGLKVCWQMPMYGLLAWSPHESLPPRCHGQRSTRPEEIQRMINARRLACAFSGFVFTVALALAPTAHAQTVRSLSCPPAAVTHPFLRWGDASSYLLAPGGNFEKAMWALTGQARRMAGGDPFLGASTGESLALGGGSSAESPAMCMSAAYRTLRFFLSGRGNVQVQLVDGARVKNVATVSAREDWDPTPVIDIGSAVASSLSSGTAQLSVRLIGLTGTVKVDDVFIDPWNRG